MTRLKQAWLALTGRLEVERVPVPGKAMVREIYRVDWTVRHFGFRSSFTTDHCAYFEACTDAHKTGHRVTAIKALKTNDGYYLPVQRLNPIEVEGKPKIAKGKRK